jgi:GH15 family glucan-1,4-alpha-glucosidase
MQARHRPLRASAEAVMPMLRYISPTDPRWLSTMDRIEECLTEDSLVFRYASRTDGIVGDEGWFTACSFWFVECLARAGKTDNALLSFSKILGFANHLALISAATFLNRKLDGVKETWA